MDSFEAEDARALRLLRHHRQYAATGQLCLSGRTHLALLAEPALVETGYALGALPAHLEAIPAATSAYRSLLCLDETIILKNRMREIR